ncbi:MAG: hypothetical protein JRJ58_16635, partial [Deltaproteobacteria bacterium]|nr:hypothetical protein [Deltaproteobacteria bacterium]
MNLGELAAGSRREDKAVDAGIPGARGECVELGLSVDTRPSESGRRPGWSVRLATATGSSASRCLASQGHFEVAIDDLGKLDIERGDTLDSLPAFADLERDQTGERGGKPG